MIRYALVCEAAPEFESWFPGAEAYEQQVKRGLVTCPFCNTARVSKAIMAPNVARKDRDAPEAKNQIAVADVIILNKTDLVTPAELRGEDDEDPE